jgi:hypothetical protein
MHATSQNPEPRLPPPDPDPQLPGPPDPEPEEPDPDVFDPGFDPEPSEAVASRSFDINRLLRTNPIVAGRALDADRSGNGGEPRLTAGRGGIINVGLGRQCQCCTGILDRVKNG